ncbi:hypothetical protein AB0M02_32915 [Actinoplanes sp. NPDC051861]|uniref:hypothetical protein n=1 Tax=Actinoplanes sp. NPDC051861 TaxID=3155170 RepID=UPI0034438994
MSHPVPPAPPAPVDPSAELARLRDLLAQAEATAQASGSQAKSLKADLGTLEKASQDLDKAVDGYAKARPGLGQQKGDLADYAEEKRPSVVLAVGPRKGAVDSAVTWFEQRESEAATKATDTETARVDAERDLAAKQAAAGAAQDAYTAAKDRVKALGDWLKTVDGLRTAMEKAEDDNKPVLRYATLLEFDRVLKKVDLKEIAAYRTELITAWKTLADRQQALRESDEKRAKATFTAAAAKQALATLRSERIARIVEHAEKQP